MGQAGTIRRISVVGLGKLGAPIVAVLAAKGYEVVGIDLVAATVEKIAAGVATVEEPGLQEMLSANKARISATTDWSKAVGDTDFTYIIVPTPSGHDGAFKNDHLLAVMDEIGKVLAKKPGYHLVAVNSTTMPGSMDGPIKARLERASGRKVGPDMGLCYNPEFIALGDVINGLLHPDFVLIGECDKRAGDLLVSIYRRVVGDKASIARMNFVNAELVKLSINTYVTTKISFANMLSEICDRYEGADVDVVTGALGHDTRIGKKYLRGATGYGGPCFPRDTVAFATMARQAGASADLASATDVVNARQLARLRDLVCECTPAGKRVAVLGLAYKVDTPVIERSQGVALAAALAESGFAVIVHDPLALDPARSMLGEAVEYASTAELAVAGAATAVLMTAWPHYKALTPESFRGVSRPVIIDCWRMLDRNRFEGRVELLYLGRHKPAKSAHKRFRMRTDCH
jgi:UDPglucose 6-dehydrogenase